MMKTCLIRIYFAFIGVFLGVNGGIGQLMPSEVEWLEKGKSIAHTLYPNRTHSYKINLTKGQFLSTTINWWAGNVLIEVSGPNDTKITRVESPSSNQDGELVAFKALGNGTYTITIRLPKLTAEPIRYEIQIQEILSAKVYARRIALEKRKQKAVVNWLKTNVVPLNTIEAGNDFADLAPLKEILQNVRYVALGEAVHGAHEFLLVKHRLLAFLAREMNFRVFAIEGSYAMIQRINDYVAGQAIDDTVALGHQENWPWNTEEVWDMVVWARGYNANVAPDKQLKFVGIDNQLNRIDQQRLIDYLRRVAPERVETTQAFFQINLDSLAFYSSDTFPLMKRQLVELQIDYDSLLTFLDVNAQHLISVSSQAEYEKMSEYARMLAQYVTSFSQQDSVGVSSRDRYMADNFKRLVAQEPAETRFVLWSHNGHITAGYNGFFMPTGGYLRQTYGNAYYALGLSFGRGSFLAREAQPRKADSRMLMPFVVNTAPKMSVDWYLTQTGRNAFIVDLRSEPKSKHVVEWLNTPLRMRSIGSVYAREAERNYFYPTLLGERYDGLLFIDTLSPARPNSSVKNVVGRNGK